jgi:hypothetical protein
MESNARCLRGWPCARARVCVSLCVSTSSLIAQQCRWAHSIVHLIDFFSSAHPQSLVFSNHHTPLDTHPCRHAYVPSDVRAQEFTPGAMAAPPQQEMYETTPDSGSGAQITSLAEVRVVLCGPARSAPFALPSVGSSARAHARTAHACVRVQVHIRTQTRTHKDARTRAPVHASLLCTHTQHECTHARTTVQATKKKMPSRIQSDRRTFAARAPWSSLTPQPRTQHRSHSLVHSCTLGLAQSRTLGQLEDGEGVQIGGQGISGGAPISINLDEPPGPDAPEEEVSSYCHPSIRPGGATSSTQHQRPSAMG